MTRAQTFLITNSALHFIGVVALFFIVAAHRHLVILGCWGIVALAVSFAFTTLASKKL